MSVPRGVTACLLAVVLLMPATAAAVAETIPHEQFDQAELDLAVLMLLLNESLRLATESILSCVADDTTGAITYSDRLQESLAAPTEIIDDLSHEVESYDFLITFIPPFETMSVDDSSITETYSIFFDDLTTLRLLAEAAVLPPEVYEEAMTILSSAMAQVKELLHQLDVLEDDANVIGALPEIPEQGILDVQPLLDAIALLREKLAQLEMELELLAEKILNPVPRLFLVLNYDSLYLGQTLIITGYLFYMGQFVSDQDIRVFRDGTDFSDVNTGASGRFAITYYIPIDPVELGTYTFASSTVFSTVEYWSDDATLIVSKIPTNIALYPEESYVIGSTPTVAGILRDYVGSGLAEQVVSATVDTMIFDFVTDDSGYFDVPIVTNNLGFGSHNLSARYPGNSTHQGSSTPIYEFLLKYSAQLTLEVSGDEFEIGEDIRFNGTFTNISDEPIGAETIRLIVDDRYFTSTVTLDNGTFVIASDSEDIGKGDHVAFVEHDGIGTIWFYTKSNEVVFTITDKESPNIFPGVDTNPKDFFDAIKDFFTGTFLDFLKDLFFGELAWLAWIILIIIIVLAYFVYKKLRERVWAKRLRDIGSQKTPVFEAKIVKEKVRPLSTLPATQSKKLMKATLWRLIDSLLGSMSPKDAVVIGYQKFLQFLVTDRNASVDNSLTHREIQSELVFMGYPKETVGKITNVYEKAMFTEHDVTIEDALGFADSLALLEGFGRAVPE